MDLFYQNLTLQLDPEEYCFFQGCGFLPPTDLWMRWGIMVSKWYPTMLGISLRELPEREECVLKFLCWNLHEFVTRHVIYVLIISDNYIYICIHQRGLDHQKTYIFAWSWTSMKSIFTTRTSYQPDLFCFPKSCSRTPSFFSLFDWLKKIHSSI